MAYKSPALIQSLVATEIGRLVSGALETGSVLSAPSVAAGIIRLYPNFGLIPRRIEDDVRVAAESAGVTVKIDERRAPADSSR